MTQRESRLQIAVQKSGRLTEKTMHLLARCGLEIRKSKDQLFCYEDVCDLGIAGLNIIEEKRLSGALGSDIKPYHILRRLGFGQCRLSIAAPHGTDWSGPAALAGKRIATSYPALTRDFLRQHDISAEVVYFSGAV